MPVLLGTIGYAVGQRPEDSESSVLPISFGCKLHADVAQNHNSTLLCATPKSGQ
jgi:hypothetical protein